MAIAIRPFDPGDITAITAIYRHHVLHGFGTYELDPPELTEMERRFAALSAGGFPIRVACNAGDVIGYAYAGPYHTRPGWRFTLEDAIYIDPDHIGGGVGSALLADLVAAAEAGPWRQMIAVIGDSAHNHASMKLHRRHGFAMVGTLPATGWKGEEWRDTAIMQRPLGAGSTARPAHELMSG